PPCAAHLEEVAAALCTEQVRVHLLGRCPAHRAALPWPPPANRALGRRRATRACAELRKFDVQFFLFFQGGGFGRSAWSAPDGGKNAIVVEAIVPVAISARGICPKPSSA
ncbi:unnamed protein product, partial [Prorocentrum cordatum]